MWYSGDSKAIPKLVQPNDLYMQLKQSLWRFARNVAGTGTSNRIRESSAQSYPDDVGHFNRDLPMPRHSPRHGSDSRLYRRSEPNIRNHAVILILESSPCLPHSRELEIG